MPSIASTRSSAATLAISIAVSAATAFFVGRATGRERAPAEDAASSLKESLRDVEATLREIRQALAERPVLATAPATGDEAPAPPAAPPQPARAGSSASQEPVQGTRPAPPSGPTAPLLPAADLSRAAEIHDWESREEVRRRWFLVSEAEVLAVFGTPHSVGEWGAGERWDYWNEEWYVSFCFLRGRLVRIHSTDKRN